MIPFTKTCLTGDEAPHFKEALSSLMWAGNGRYSEKCQALLTTLTGCDVLLTSSGTHALELAFMAMNFNPGDEVILPSFTFVSTANCLVQMGLKPVFVDIRPDTLNIDETLIAQAITEKTRAILPVHYAGVAADMDAILEIAGRHGLAVVEDAAQGVNAFYKDRALGSLGDLGIFSFHQTKNVSCGEGGAICVRNRELLKKIDIHRQKGTNRSDFLRGQVDKYTWIDRGSNYVLSELLAAVLYPQLEKAAEITSKRRAVYEYYLAQLKNCAKGNFRLPVIPDACRSNYHIFYILLNERETQEALRSHLKKRGIEATTHFVPLHSSPGGKKFGITRGPMTVTDQTADRLLRLPLYPSLQQSEQDQIMASIRTFFS